MDLTEAGTETIRVTYLKENIIPIMKGRLSIHHPFRMIVERIFNGVWPISQAEAASQYLKLVAWLAGHGIKLPDGLDVEWLEERLLDCTPASDRTVDCISEDPDLGSGKPRHLLRFHNPCKIELEYVDREGKRRSVDIFSTKP